MITNDPSPLQTESAVASEPIQPQIPTETTSGPRPWIDVVIAFLIWVGSVLLLLFIPVLAVIPYIVNMVLKGQNLDPAALTQDKTFLFISIVSVIPAHILTLLGIWIVIKKVWKDRLWANLKLSWPPGLAPWRGIAACFGVSILLLGLGSLLVKYLGGGKTDLDFLIESSFRARIATAFIAVATAPLVEEIIYRGILYPAIQRLLGMGWSILVVTLMFAIVHVPQYKNNIGVIVVITVLSVVLTVVRAWSDRLLPSVVIHVFFNGLQSLYLVLEPFIEKPPTVEPTSGLMMLGRMIRHLF